MAEKTLVVVESPAKAKTINKYLGSKYIVEASVGHVKDLIKVRLGVDIKNGFQPKYTVIQGKSKVIKKLKQLSESSANVLIATDPDREGEAIAWHIAEELKDSNDNIKRVLFNEITKAGIEKGIKEPRTLDENLFMSQQARRVMDRIIGYQVSPFVSKAMIHKTSKALSAGRVQSVALRLICEREKEIQAFQAIEYWNIFADFETDTKKEFSTRLVAFDGKSIKNPEGSAASPTDDSKKTDELNYIRTEKESLELLGRIKQQSYKIDQVTEKDIRRSAPSPFTTSLLQQESSRRLGFSNKKTMQIAQKLYEGVSLGKETAGLITYMRTDSTRISPEAQEAATKYVAATFGNEYVPDVPNKFTSKSPNVQDAHEAIRPASLEHTPKEVRKYLDKDEAALYELIYNRFLASQMKPALIKQTTVNLTGGEFVFRATGSVVTFKGFLAAYDDIKDAEKSANKDEANMLPPGLKEGLKVGLISAENNQSSTKPKPRFSESSLVKELDDLGIGRPSTYAQIISTIVDRSYVELAKKSFQPTELGMDVTEVLVKNFPDIFNVAFTAEMEQELDDIAEGTKTYLSMLNDFYNPFSTSLKKADEHNELPEIPCPECGAPMMIRVSRKGRFLGCTRYPECKGTKPLPKGEMDTVEKKEPQIAEGEFCTCGRPMLIRESKFGRFYGCSGYPECKEIRAITSGLKCPKCHDGDVLERFSPKSRKKFWGCSRYPKCDFITNYEPVSISCEECGHNYLEYRFRKVDETYEKYLKCPHCKKNYEKEAIQSPTSGT
jgi:DNA topoisomerase-1